MVYQHSVQPLKRGDTLDQSGFEILVQVVPQRMLIERERLWGRFRGIAEMGDDAYYPRLQLPQLLRMGKLGMADLPPEDVAEGILIAGCSNSLQMCCAETCVDEIAKFVHDVRQCGGYLENRLVEFVVIASRTGKDFFPYPMPALLKFCKVETIAGGCVQLFPKQIPLLLQPLKESYRHQNRILRVQVLFQVFINATKQRIQQANHLFLLWV